MLRCRRESDKIRMGSMSTKPSVALEPAPPRATGAIRWTRETVARLEEIGVLPQKYELLDGDIISKMGQGLPHRRAVGQLLFWAFQGWGPELVQTQATIDVSPEDNPTNAPEPDIAVLNRSLADFPDKANPDPGSIGLLIEISDSTLRDDLSKKAALYARAGIAEYWVFDTATKKLFVHRQPTGDGYQERAEKSGASEVAPLLRPGHTIRPEQILP